MNILKAPVSFSTKKLLMAVLATGLAVCAVRAEDVTVTKGATTRLSIAEGVRKISVANPSIISVQPSDDGKGVMITGLTEGSSELKIDRLVGGELVDIITVQADLQSIVVQLKELLSDVEGLDVKVVGSKVALTGNIVTKSGYDKIGKVASAYSGSVLNLTALERGPMNKFVEQAILKDINIPTVTARTVDDGLILEGVVYSEAEANRAVEMAKLRVAKVTNLMRVEEVTIENDIEFVQVDSLDGLDYGHNILENAAGGASFSGAGASTSLSQLAYSATTTVKVHAVLGKNNAKTVARSNVSSKSGTEGSSMVGGELGIKIAGNVGGSLEKVPYGVLVKVKPTLVGGKSVFSVVTVEVSTPTSVTAEGYTLDKAKTDTSVTCQLGESVVLSGLVQAIGSKAKSKTPLLGDVPLLDLFFSEKKSTDSKKQLVVILTPRVIFASQATGAAYSESLKNLGSSDTKK